MIRVTAPSRLHFGLFSLPGVQGEPGPLPVRVFGGVGLMIDKPGVCVTVEPAVAWSATGPLAERALAFAQKFFAGVPPGRHQAFRITVEHCAPEHAGLGAGTQLGLAVAKGMTLALGLGAMDAVALAQRIGRGERSALGIHGFQHGGFLVEGGKSAAQAVAPLLVRHPFPDDWRVLLILPKNLQGAHGQPERDAFARLAQSDPDPGRTAELCRLVLLGMLPALVERDLAAFGEALYAFNRKVGEMFQPWQGGLYAHPQTDALVELLRGHGIMGVGQSSWGPAVFAVLAKDQVNEIVGLIGRQGFGADEMVIAAGVNQGCMVLPACSRLAR